MDKYTFNIVEENGDILFTVTPGFVWDKADAENQIRIMVQALNKAGTLPERVYYTDAA